MAGRFYFGDDSVPTSQVSSSRPEDQESGEEYEDDYDTTSLPFPKPLSRTSFLTDDFEPHAFLASLSTSNRFQTLEDLQTELRELSTTVNKELVDLVNANYEEFVSLGVDLRGGEEKVEEVRVGLLGFEKDIRSLRDRLLMRREEVQKLVASKRDLRREIGVGRGLLEIDERLSGLETKLGLQDSDKDAKSQETQQNDTAKWLEEWDEDDLDAHIDQEYGDEKIMQDRIRTLVDDFLAVRILIRKYDSSHPFLLMQKDRVQRIQDKVRLEVETAIRGADQLAIKQGLIYMRVQMDGQINK